MSGSGRWKQKKERQFARQDGLCFYCQKPMRIVGRQPHGTRTPHDAATFEHLDDRSSDERGTRPHERRVVLACHQCNQRRADERTASIPLAELHARSGRYPRG